MKNQNWIIEWLLFSLCISALVVGIHHFVRQKKGDKKTMLQANTNYTTFHNFLPLPRHASQALLLGLNCQNKQKNAENAKIKKSGHTDLEQA